LRLFLLERTLLRHLVGDGDGPRSGDVVAFWRHAQDVDGGASVDLRSRGVIVEWIGGRVDDSTATRIDAFVDRFGQNWHRVDGEDITRGDGISFGDLCTSDLFGKALINVLVQYGVVFESVLAAYPQVSEIVTDIVDNTDWLSGETPYPNRFERRRLLSQRAETHGIPCRNFSVAEPVPSQAFHGRDPGFAPMIRSFIGGFRIKYLIGRLRLRFSRKSRPRIYVFICAGLGLVAEALGRRTDVETFTDLTGYANTTPLRFDHLLAFPSMADIRAARRLRRRVDDISRMGFDGDLARMDSIDFSPYFRSAICQLTRQSMLPTLVMAAQTRRLAALGGFDLVVINGEGFNAVQSLVGLADKFGYSTAFIDHSHTVVPFGYHPYGRNFRNVIYIAQGDDHVDSYGSKLPEEHKPRRPVVTNPATAVMDRIRGNRKTPPERRVLLTNFSPVLVYTVARTAQWDQYLIDLFTVASELAIEGYTFTYRPHPNFNNPAYLEFMLRETGTHDSIHLDDTGDFPDSLAKHDLIVVNVSGCYYQALYAGWPTVFYEPDFKAHRFVGLPAATDIERPIASTPPQLAQLIRDGLTRPDSLTARFPELFRTKYAHRFVGRNADRASDVLSEFLVEEIIFSGGTSEMTGNQKNHRVAAI
jgi:hypothetical protein